MSNWKVNGPTFTDGYLEFGAPDHRQAQRVAGLLNERDVLWVLLKRTRPFLKPIEWCNASPADQALVTELRHDIRVALEQAAAQSSERATDRLCVTCGAVLIAACGCPHCGTAMQDQSSERGEG